MESAMFGERLTSFHRNQGKQIHVLGSLQNLEDSASTGSASTGSGIRKSFKAQARDRIQKFFE